MRCNPADVKKHTAESPYRNAAILTNRFRDGDYAGIPGQYEDEKVKDKKKKTYFITMLFWGLFITLILLLVPFIVTISFESTILPALNDIIANF